jgi:3-oxoacyl-[acyl-carrier protein] reductase
MADARDESLRDKVALVTGAARGIGLEIAQRLAQSGAKVALVDVREEELQGAANKLQTSGWTAIPLIADISSSREVQSMSKSILNQWNRVDILVNNAGVCPMTRLEDITDAEWDRVLGINLKGAFLCSQAVIPVMRQQQSGKIINISSNAGQMGGIAVGVHYSASKAGILGLTKSLARLLAPHIQVNAVAPGTTESEMTRGWDTDTVSSLVKQIPLQRLGRPEDTAAAVHFLATDAASFITGHTLCVNGGLLMM